MFINSLRILHNVLWSVSTPPPTLPCPPSPLSPLYQLNFELSSLFSPSRPVCVAQLLLGVGPALEHGWPTRSLKKTDLTCPRSCQMLIEHFTPTSPSHHPSYWDFVWLELAQILCNWPVVCRNCHFLGVIHHLWLWQSSCPLLCEDLWAFWRGLCTFHLGPNTTQLSILCTLSSQRFLRLLTAVFWEDQVEGTAIALIVLESGGEMRTEALSHIVSSPERLSVVIILLSL